MKTAVLIMALLLLQSQVVPGSREKCWKSLGVCRNECSKSETIYILCWSGRLCCVRAKNVPEFSQNFK
ncbi:beta-defensin 36-like [Acomys russatus]|uniref:beta-defensin 36-like n=1 Tax=Acomys russatus TaxID=60746 RepID=UPI0021E34911|nr:beta-defensin 36-like [Acomys russatus]